MTNIKTIIIIIGTLVRSCIRQLAQVSQSSVSRLGLSCCWCCQLGALVREKNSPKKHCGWFSGGWAETSLFAHLFGNHRPSFQNRQRQQPAIRCRQGRQVRLQAVGQTDWLTECLRLLIVSNPPGLFWPQANCTYVLRPFKSR